VDGRTSLLNVSRYGSILTEAGRTALLRNSEFRNCTVNTDVVAALTLPATATAAFVTHTLPGTIQAADYDLGRLGAAYSDTYATRTDYRNHTPHNSGETYRNDGVDIDAVTDSTSRGFAVSHTEAGEWLQYTVTVPQTTACAVQVHLRNPAATTTRLLVEVNEQQVVGRISAPAGAGWQTLPAGNVQLPAGTHRIRLRVEEPGAVVSSLQFVPLVGPR
jgi:hypothetical protein